MPNGYHDVSSYDHSAAVDDAFRRGVEKGKREAGRKTAYGVYRCVQARPSRTIRTPADLHRAEFTLLAPVQGTDDARPLGGIEPPQLI